MILCQQRIPSIDSKNLLHMTTLSIDWVWCSTRNKVISIMWSLQIWIGLLGITLLAKNVRLSTVWYLLRTINWLPHCNPILSLLRKTSWPNLIPDSWCKKIIVCSQNHRGNRQQTTYDEEPRANNITVVSIPPSTITIWVVQSSPSHKWYEAVKESKPVSRNKPMKLSTGNLLPLCILQTKTLSQTSLCNCRENLHNNTLNLTTQ